MSTTRKGLGPLCREFVIPTDPSTFFAKLGGIFTSDDGWNLKQVGYSILVSPVITVEVRSEFSITPGGPYRRVPGTPCMTFTWFQRETPEGAEVTIRAECPDVLEYGDLFLRVIEHILDSFQRVGEELPAHLNTVEALKAPEGADSPARSDRENFQDEIDKVVSKLRMTMDKITVEDVAGQLVLSKGALYKKQNKLGLPSSFTRETIFRAVRQGVMVQGNPEGMGQTRSEKHKQ